MSHFLPLDELPPRLARARLRARGVWCSRVPDFARPRVGVVGSREASEDALIFASALGRGLTERGYDVVSGGAEGIDNAAHQGALDAGGCSWMVLGTALDKVNPRGAHGRLYPTLIASGGVALSQYHERDAPAPGQGRSYTSRNRTLVALVDALIVVQAAASSGTANAARHARELGVPCLVLPGPLWDPHYDGSRHIVAALGGRWVHETVELYSLVRLAVELGGLCAPARADEIHLARGRSTPSQTRRATQPTLWSEPSIPSENVLFEHLETHPQHVDTLVARTGLTTAELTAVLLTLSLKNVVRESPLGFWALTCADPPTAQ